MDGDRIDGIIRDAEDRLEYFYSVYGEWDGSGRPPLKKKSNKKKCRYPGCPRMLLKGSREVFCKEHEEKKAAPGKVSFKGLKAREIVDLVKARTGRRITLSLKSKKAIIKAAGVIFKASGYVVESC